MDDAQRETLLAVCGLDFDATAMRRELLGRPTPARRREIDEALARFRARELWRPRAEVEAIVGPEAVASALADDLVVEWIHEGGPQLVPTSLGLCRLRGAGYEVLGSERSRVDYRWPPPEPAAASLEELLEQVYYREGVAPEAVDPTCLERLLWAKTLVNPNKGERVLRPKPKGRPFPDEVIVEDDRWDFAGPAMAASPKVPTRRGTFQMDDDFMRDAVDPKSVRPGRRRKAKPADDWVKVVVHGQELLVAPDSRLAALAAPEPEDDEDDEDAPPTLLGGLGPRKAG